MSTQIYLDDSINSLHNKMNRKSNTILAKLNKIHSIQISSETLNYILMTMIDTFQEKRTVHTFISSENCGKSRNVKIERNFFLFGLEPNGKMGMKFFHRKRERKEQNQKTDTLIWNKNKIQCENEQKCINSLCVKLKNCLLPARNVIIH